MDLTQLHAWMTENCRVDLPRSVTKPWGSDELSDWADYEDDLKVLMDCDMSLTRNGMHPVSGPRTGVLVHFTDHPAEIFSTGLRGTSDIEKLSLTKDRTKDDGGFCFGYPAKSDDAANTLEPQDIGYGEWGSGYGDTALIFEAEHILIDHRGDGDRQAIFEAASFDPRSCVVMTRQDNWNDQDFDAKYRQEWSVSSPDGSVLDAGPLVWEDAVDVALAALGREPDGPSCG